MKDVLLEIVQAESVEQYVHKEQEYRLLCDRLNGAVQCYLPPELESEGLAEPDEFYALFKARDQKLLDLPEVKKLVEGKKQMLSTLIANILQLSEFSELQDLLSSDILPRRITDGIDPRIQERVVAAIFDLGSPTEAASYYVRLLIAYSGKYACSNPLVQQKFLSAVAPSQPLKGLYDYLSLRPKKEGNDVEGLRKCFGEVRALFESQKAACSSWLALFEGADSKAVEEMVDVMTAQIDGFVKETLGGLSQLPPEGQIIWHSWLMRYSALVKQALVCCSGEKLRKELFLRYQTVYTALV